MSELLLEVVKFVVQGLVLGGAGLLVTTIYSKKQQQLAEDEFNHKLLMRFNDWYDELNNNLHEIKTLENGKQEISLEYLKKQKPDLYSTLHDYLNLCAEEKLWNRKGRIDPIIWNSWVAGMNYWYKELQALKELWGQEKKTTNKDSYYLKKSDDLFPETKRTDS